MKVKKYALATTILFSFGFVAFAQTIDSTQSKSFCKEINYSPADLNRIVVYLDEKSFPITKYKWDNEEVNCNLLLQSKYLQRKRVNGVFAGLFAFTPAVLFIFIVPEYIIEPEAIPIHILMVSSTIVTAIPPVILFSASKRYKKKSNEKLELVKKQLNW